VNKRTKSEIFTAILVFIMGFGCGVVWVLRYTDTKSFNERYTIDKKGE